MANSWGELSWGLGDWGTQNDTLLIPTGVVSSVLVNSVEYSGELGGWGQFTWGFNEWGDLLNPNVDITGLQLNTFAGNEDALANTLVPVSTNLLNFSEGSISVLIGQLVEPNSFLLNSTVNSVFAGESIFVQISTPGTSTTWGQYGWGVYDWNQITGLASQQGEETISISVGVNINGIQLNTTVGTAFAAANFVEIPDSVVLNTTVNSVFAGENVIVEVNTPGTPTEWGSLAWGQGAWNQISGILTLQGDEFISGTGIVDVTGVQSNTSTGISFILADANVTLNTNLLNTTTGTVDHIIDTVVEVTTNLIQISIGDESISATAIANVAGVQSNTSTGTFTITGDSNLTLNTNLLNITASPILAVVDVTVEVTTPGSPTTWGNYAWGQQAWGQIIGLEVDQGAEEVVVPSIEVDVIGVQLTPAIGSLSIVADANVTPNTNLLTTSLGDEDVTPNTIVVLSTNLITASVGNASGQALVDVSVTGVNMTTSTGRLYISAWAVINIGVSNTWSVVDIAA